MSFDVQRAHQAASDVVNGFARVRDQQARDVLALVAELEQERHARELLERRLDEARAKINAAGSQSPGFAGIFDDLFKDIKAS